MIITELTAVVGAVLGSLGFGLSLFNYLRDRPLIKVSLLWDMTDVNTGESVAAIQIRNVGRRAVFVSHVALCAPEIAKSWSHLLLPDSVQGTKLGEGDAPLMFTMPYGSLPPEVIDWDVKTWKKVKAQVSLSTGKVKYSNNYPSLRTVVRGILRRRILWSKFKPPTISKQG